MEAFILAEKVITKEHLEPNSTQHFKYLKRYNLPDKPTTAISQSPRNTRQKYNFYANHTQPFAKTKKLLSELSSKGENSVLNNIINNSTTQSKAFFIQNPRCKTVNRMRKYKLNLLIRNIEPQRQQYNVNFNPIVKTSPSWTFIPHRAHTYSPAPHTHQPHRKSKDHSKQCSWRGANREISEGEEAIIEKIQKQIYEQMREKTGIGKRHSEKKLQYYPEELFNSTSDIFKKYHLDKDNHFQKFLQSIKPKPNKYA